MRTRRVAAHTLALAGLLLPSAPATMRVADARPVDDQRPDSADRSYVGPRAPLSSITFASAGRTVAAGGQDGLVRVWDVASGRLLRLLRAPGEVFDVAAPGAGAWIAAVGDGPWLRIWDARTGALHRTIRLEGWGVALAWSADASKVIVATQPSGVAAYDLSGRLLWRRALSFPSIVVAEGDAVLAGTGRLRILGPAGDSLAVLARSAGQVSGACTAANARHVVTASRDGWIRVWDRQTRDTVRGLRPHFRIRFRVGTRELDYPEHRPLTAAACSPEGTGVAVAGVANTAYLYDGPELRLVRTLEGHRLAINDIAFDAGGRRVATAGADGTVRLWGVPGGPR